MNIIDSECERPIEDQQPCYLSSHIQHFQALQKILASGALSDFVIKVEEKEFPVHKVLLGAQSYVFQAIFENDMKERRSGEMRIEEFAERTVEEFIHYFYTGEVRDDNNAMDLFAIAAKYDVETLKTMCEKFLLQKIDRSNAFDILNLGHLYSSEKLKGASFRVIKKIFPKLSNLAINDRENLKKLIDTYNNFEDIYNLLKTL